MTIIKNPISTNNATNNGENNGNASPALSTSSSGSLPAASAAMQAIKRHALDFVNPREMMVRVPVNYFYIVPMSHLCLYFRTKMRAQSLKVFGLQLH